MATDRTTVRLDGALLRAAKQRAIREHTTVTALITRALRREIEQPARDQRPGADEFPLMDGGGGWIAPVNPFDASAVLDHLDELDAADEGKPRGASG
ncbi:MAG: hypothetical protein ACR2LK_10585 [Solirubrobacteraceae bacterium]